MAIRNKTEFRFCHKAFCSRDHHRGLGIVRVNLPNRSTEADGNNDTSFVDFEWVSHGIDGEINFIYDLLMLSATRVFSRLSSKTKGMQKPELCTRCHHQVELVKM